jgi:DNA-binding LytR/AlgR family response regulator
MTELSVLTVDDEPLALLRLEQTLQRIPNVTHVGAASRCSEALEKAVQLKPDVILLDISMRDGSGFDVLDQLPDGNAPAVIFVTAFDHFAPRAFETSAVDYVLKPVSAPRLKKAIERARARLEASDASAQLTELRTIVQDLRRKLRDERTGAAGAEFWIRASGGGLVRVHADDIEWITSEEDYVRLHTRTGEYLMRHSIRGLLPKIGPEEFVRVHRNAVVRQSAIRSVQRTPLGALEVILISGARVSAGRVYAKQLLAYLRHGDKPQ